MKETDRDSLRLTDILHSINIIQGYIEEITFVDFYNNEMMQSACVRHLEIIGEASSKISENLKKEHFEIPWREIIGLRNIVAHEYSRVDLGEIWTTILHDLPPLKEQISGILNK